MGAFVFRVVAENDIYRIEFDDLPAPEKKHLVSKAAANGKTASTVTVLAQDEPNSKTDRSDYTHDRLAHPGASRLNSAA